MKTHLLLLGLLSIATGACGTEETRSSQISATAAPAPTFSPTTTPIPIPIPTPTPEPTATQSAAPEMVWGEIEIAVATPTPTSRRPPRRRPEPTPTPSIEACVAFEVQSSEVGFGKILVEIEARNLCDRTILANEVWFEVRAWRQGDLLSVDRGHLFDDLSPNGFQMRTGIGVQGSLSWIDRIDVHLQANPGGH